MARFLCLGTRDIMGRSTSTSYLFILYHEKGKKRPQTKQNKRMSRAPGILTNNLFAQSI